MQPPSGRIKTRAPWGGRFDFPWERITRWQPIYDAAYARFPRVPQPVLEGICLVESGGIHYEDDGSVLTRGSDDYDTVPAIGMMQVKLGYHAWLLPDVDGTTPEGNVLIAAALLDRGIRDHGTWQRAFVSVYFTGTDYQTGTTQAAYVATIEGVIKEWGAVRDEQPAEPAPDSNPIVFGRVPHPPFEDRIIEHSRAWDDLGPRRIVGVCNHSMVGSLRGTDTYFRGEARHKALTDYGVGGSADGALDGVIYRWNDPRGRRSPWANGPANGLEGDGPAFLRAYGVNAINNGLVSIERSDGGTTSTPVSPKQFESIAALMAHWADQSEVPWDRYPLNPAKHVVTYLEHWEIGQKDCPFPPVRRRSTDLTARARAIMKQYQTGAVEAPEIPPELPPPAPIEPSDGYPFGMTPDLASALFGELLRVSTGQRYPFDPSNAGVVSMAWLARGDAEDVFPAADKWIDEPDGSQLFTFTNGWVLMHEPSNEKRDWLWLGDEEGTRDP